LHNVNKLTYNAARRNIVRNVLTLLASMRIALFCHLSFSCFPRFTLFSFTPLFWFICAMQLFLQFLTFPIPGRSIIIALNGDVQPRINAPFPFQNILSRPWSVKISLTDGTSCWIHLVKPWIWGLSYILQCRKKWAVGVMVCRNNWLSE
jgi:hypothetical protein